MALLRGLAVANPDPERRRAPAMLDTGHRPHGRRRPDNHECHWRTLGYPAGVAGLFAPDSSAVLGPRPAGSSAGIHISY